MATVEDKRQDMLGKLRKEVDAHQSAMVAPMDGQTTSPKGGGGGLIPGIPAASPSQEQPTADASDASDSRVKMMRCPFSLKSLGNECFAASEWLQAIEAYSKAIDLLHGRPMPPGHGDMQAQLASLISALHCNRAACYLKTGAWREASEDCSKVLVIDSKNIKALYRRSQAREGMGNIPGAMEDLRTLLTVDPDNIAGIRLTSEMRERHGLQAPPGSNDEDTSARHGKKTAGPSHRLKDLSEGQLEELKSRGLLSVYSNDPDYAEMVFGKDALARRDENDVRPWEGVKGSIEQPPVTRDEQEEESPMENFTPQQLAYHNGSAPYKSVYLSLKHVVHDATSGFSHYGKGGAYHLFAGHEISTSLALMSFDLKYVDDYDYIKTLGEKDALDSLDNWCETYNRKYPPVGRLVTDFSKRGEVTRSELSAHTGTGPVPEGWASAPIWVAIRGTVYDVSFGGTALFGPGGPYASLAGKDATLALAKMSLADAHLDYFGSGESSAELDEILTESEKETLASWSKRFKEYKKYPVVGSLSAE